MEPTTKRPSRHGLIIEFGVFVLLVVAFLGANYLYGRHQRTSADQASGPSLAKVPVAARQMQPSVSPSVTATPASAAFVVAELGIAFVAPTSLDDLTYVVVKPVGRTSGISVGFSSDRLAAAGCSAASGALGFVSDISSDTPGEVALARTGEMALYYRPASKACDQGEASAQSASLRQALENFTTTASEAAR